MILLFRYHGFAGHAQGSLDAAVPVLVVGLDAVRPVHAHLDAPRPVTT